MRDLQTEFDQDRFKRDLIAELLRELRNPFLSIKEFAEIMKFKEQTVKSWCIKGHLKATQVVPGGDWRIDAKEVDRLLEEAKRNHYAKANITTKRDNIILNTKRPDSKIH